jgi:sec-independent protein translocase protein TatA
MGARANSSEQHSKMSVKWLDTRWSRSPPRWSSYEVRGTQGVSRPAPADIAQTLWCATPPDAKPPCMRLGFGEIVVILVIALLVFGPAKLPQLGDALGKGIRNFKKATEGIDDAPLVKEPPNAELSAHPQGATAAASPPAAIERKQS